MALSDGTNLDLSAAIQDSDTDVQQVSYAIHIPSGVSVLSVLYTDGPLGPKEVLTVSENNPPDIYDVSTVVSTLTSHIAVTATAEAVSAVMISSASSSGWDNAPLRVEVSSS